MVVIHAFIALLAGFLTIAALVAAAELLLKRLAPGWSDGSGLRAGNAVANLGIAFLAAASGGYVTAWIAGANPLYHVLALGIAVLGLAALSALQEKGNFPVAYQLTLVALTPMGVLAGGLLRLRVLGIL